MKKRFNVVIGAIAKIEIEEAATWYEEQKIGLGELFLEAFEKSIEKIQKSPSAFTLVKHHRQFPVKYFPFVILYEIVDETLFIDAVFHTSRDPKEKIRKPN